MPLLYRVLMRLSLLLTALGVLGWIGITAVDGTGGSMSIWLLGLAVFVAPGIVLAAIAWVIRPPLDRESLRRLWRE